MNYNNNNKYKMMSGPILISDSYVSLQPLIVHNPILMNKYTDLVHKKKFISRVYTILWFQILFTSVFIGLCNKVILLQKFMLSPLGINISYISCILILFTSCILVCLYDSIRLFPYNYIYLISFTILITYPLGLIGIFIDTQTLLLCGLTTFGVFTGLTIYAFQTKVNYTMYGNTLIICLFGLMMLGIFISFVNIPVLNSLYSVGGVTLFSFYIVYDTQLITGGAERDIVYTVDDYVIASINLYLDFINLFIFLLDIVGGRN